MQPSSGYGSTENANEVNKSRYNEQDGASKAKGNNADRTHKEGK